MEIIISIPTETLLLLAHFLLAARSWLGRGAALRADGANAPRSREGRAAPSRLPKCPLLQAEPPALKQETRTRQSLG